MRKGRIAAVAAIGLIAAAAGTAVAGTADGQGAQKRALVVTTTQAMNDECQPGATSPSSGFAILNAPGKVGSVSKINGEVSLKKGPPNTTFIVNLAQDGVCVMQGMLTTNGQGNGNFHIDQPGALGAGPYYVVLQDTIMMQEAYATSPVLLK